MGIFALVLHTHLPYVRRNGVWPSGEDFFHQAATESYLPLLETLERMANRPGRGLLSVGITPLVAHQMQDDHMLRELRLYLGRYELRALRQVANYEGAFAAEFKDLAAFYARHGRRRLARLEAAPDGLARAFAALEETGLIEILGGPASHPLLPQVQEEPVLRAQIAQGLAEHVRVFGRRPRGVWLPECGYRPDAGIEELLAAEGIAHFVVDGPTMIRSDGRGSTFRPRLVGDSPVAAFARNLEVSHRVWSPTGGYPANKWYRDFHHYDMEAGFKNWRVTSRRLPLGRKKPYEPDRALARAAADAEDFVALLDRALAACEERTGEEGLVVACYDTELFGHWWFEGPAWLERLFALLERHPRIRPMSLERALEALPPVRRVHLVEGSWGIRKDLRSWVGPETEDLWRALAETESETVRLARKFAEPTHGQGLALAQLTRELFLMQSSDWPYMVLRGNNPGYARERFWGHRERWQRLAGALLRGAPDAALEREASGIREIDNPFPRLTAAELA